MDYNLLGLWCLWANLDHVIGMDQNQHAIVLSNKETKDKVVIKAPTMDLVFIILEKSFEDIIRQLKSQKQKTLQKELLHSNSGDPTNLYLN